MLCVPFNFIFLENCSKTIFLRLTSINLIFAASIHLWVHNTNCKITKYFWKNKSLVKIFSPCLFFRLLELHWFLLLRSVLTACHITFKSLQNLHQCQIQEIIFVKCDLNRAFCVSICRNKADLTVKFSRL